MNIQRMIALVMSGGKKAAIPWYLAGNIPLSGCVAAYQPKGAESLAASYSNLVSPGTLDVGVGIAPTWNVADGWVFSSGSQYLTTGIVMLSSYTVVIKFKDAESGNGVIFGGRTAASNGTFIQPNTSAVGYTNGSSVTVGAGLASGVLALAGSNGYRNGTGETTGAGSHTNTTIPAFIGMLNDNGTPVVYWVGKIQALAIYNYTLTADQVAAVVAAMNRITIGITGLVNNHIHLGNVLQYERTQAWSVGCVAGMDVKPGHLAVAFSNVPNQDYFPGYEWYIDTDGLINVRLIHQINTVAPNGSIWIKGATDICDKKDHKIWVTYNGSSLAAGVKIYIDHVIETPTVLDDTLGASIVNAAQNFYLTSQVAYDDSVFFENGWIRNFVIDNVERDQTFITANNSVITKPTLIANRQLILAFDEGVGTFSRDLSGNGFHATLTSSSMWR